MLTLRYFGPFEVRRGGELVAFPTRPAARLFALLATEPGKRWRRESVAHEIWPDTEYATEGTSLRTALTMLRRTLGPGVLGSDRERVWLEGDALASDLDRFGFLLRREASETDPERREETLADLVATPPAFLEGWEAAWLLPLRHEHARAVARVALELSRVRLASGQYEAARELAFRSLAARPGNDHAIAIAVRASVALGERDEALELAARSGASPELRRLAEEIERNPAPIAAPAPVDATDLLFDAFESNLEHDPEGAVRFLMGNRSFWWRQREIARAKTLLELGLRAELSPPLRALTLHTLGMLHFRTADYLPTLAAGEAALALDPERNLRNDLRMVRGATLLEMRRWEDAEREMEAHRAQMAREPRDYRTNWVALNQASLASNLLRLDEARALYAFAREDFIGDEFRRTYGEAHIDLGLAELARYEGDWNAVARHADASREVLTVRVDPFAASVPNALALLARAATGDAGVLRRLVAAPLDPVRSGMRRMALVTFDLVAEGLAYLGRGAAAHELLNANALLRAGIGHERSPMEEASADRTRGTADARPGASVPPAPTAGLAPLAAWVAARSDEL